MPDPQADRVIDRIMAERRRAEAIAQKPEEQHTVEEINKVDMALAEAGASQPSRMSEIQKIVQEKGEVGMDDLKRLIARDMRRGL